MSDEQQNKAAPPVPTVPDYKAIMAHPQFEKFLQMEVLVRAHSDQVLKAAYDETAKLPDGHEKAEAQATTQLMSAVNQMASAYLQICKMSVGWEGIDLIVVPTAVQAEQIANQAPAKEEAKVAAG